MTLKVPKVSMWSFVMPIYDLEHVGYIPTTEKFAVEYQVFGWDYVEQEWNQIDCCELYEEGVKVAQEYHNKMLKIYQISSE